ncbi:Ig family protein [Alicycliphilus sp. B1]|nr:Ig family protein [Alicycliphilus sp. B1]
MRISKTIITSAVFAAVLSACGGGGGSGGESHSTYSITLRADKTQLRIPLMADSDSISIADSVPCDGGHVARVS